MNKRISSYKKIFGAIIVLLVSFSVMHALAQTTPTPTVTYVPLQPNAFPGVTENAGNLSAFLGSVFNYGIALAVVLALVMIIFGGIQLMTTDSWEKKDEGKTHITNALLGLALALISWLLLYIINPNLVTFSGNTLINPPAKSTQSTAVPFTGFSGGGNPSGGASGSF